jgi:DNA-binding transcriptional MocR family regulator
MEIDGMTSATVAGKPREAASDSSWAPDIRKSEGPVYLAIARAIAADIQSGRLAPGARLPPQRALAERLGIDFTTVSRGYAEARQRGLIEGKVGQGTYVRARAPVSRPSPAGGRLVDMSMNLPPQFDDPALTARMWKDIAALEADGGVGLLLRYVEVGGSEPDRQAAARWLSKRLPGIPLERVLIGPGAQSSLLALTTLLAVPEDTILTEALTYPGFRALAAHLRIRLVGLAMDAQGIDPDAFEAACRRHNPKALYCTPTLHNPTTATMTIERRNAIIAVARRHGVPIIEDDAYGFVPSKSPPPLAALAPEITYYVGGLAKCLSPALRIAYLAVPDPRKAARITAALRATAAMASPLTSAIATRWIEEGTAEAVLSAVRAEAAARQEAAVRILPSGMFAAQPESFHLWLSLPAPWTRAEFATRLQATGVGAVISDAFSLDKPPEALRISLGAAKSRNDVIRGLEAIADLLSEPPALSSMVV